MIIQYKKHSLFEKQFNKLLHKYRTLEEDLLIAQVAAIELFHMHHLDNNSVELIPCFVDEKIKIYKLRKFACKSLKGKGVKSGIRIIYAFYSETLEVEYLEIYYKERDDSDMDYKFVKKYFKEKFN